MNSQSCFFLCFFSIQHQCVACPLESCVSDSFFSMRDSTESRECFCCSDRRALEVEKTFQLIATCLQSTWNRFALTAAAAQSHNLGLYVVFLPELFSQSKTSETQLFFFSAFCTDAHLHFSFRCDGWIRAKDWSSVSRGCSRCQRIHRKVGMLCSGKVSPLLVKLSMLTGT